MDLDAELELALAIVDDVDTLTLERFISRDFDVDWKSNQTEVTEVDHSAESLIVERLRAERPGHGLFGEEHGLQGDSDSAIRWVIDPIDGTSGFARGIPVWGTLLAFSHVHDGPLFGVVSAPALGRRWWGGVGLGAHVDGIGGSRPLHVSSVSTLSEAQICVTHSSGWDELGLTPLLIDLQRGSRRARGMGDFWQHMLVAEGAMDVAIDAVGVAPYDLAALQPIVEAAGGRFSDRHGAPTHEHDTAISSNGILHDEVIELLSGGQ
jgi:histidinol-phosphatase